MNGVFHLLVFFLLLHFFCFGCLFVRWCVKTIKTRRTCNNKIVWIYSCNKKKQYSWPLLKKKLSVFKSYCRKECAINGHTTYRNAYKNSHQFNLRKWHCIALHVINKYKTQTSNDVNINVCNKTKHKKVLLLKVTYIFTAGPLDESLCEQKNSDKNRR